MKMKKPNYPIVQPSQMKPRDQIVLMPEKELDPFVRAEISNIRAGIKYSFVVADTPSNRENFNFKALYLQMVAYKEGWKFNPDNLQVVYVPTDDPRLPADGSPVRIMNFIRNEVSDEDAEIMEASNEEAPLVNLPYGISPGGRLGFRVDEIADSVTQMKPEEADDLGARVIKLFH